MTAHQATAVKATLNLTWFQEKGEFSPIAQGMHIHSALNDVVQNAFGDLQPA
jgi:hypothetical protein